MNDFFHEELKKNFESVLITVKDMDIKILNKKHLLIIAFSSKSASKILFEEYIKNNPGSSITEDTYRKKILQELWWSVEESDSIEGDTQQVLNDDADVDYTHSFLKIIKQAINFSISLNQNKFVSSEDLMASLIRDEAELYPDSYLNLSDHLGKDLTEENVNEKAEKLIKKILSLSEKDTDYVHGNEKELMAIAESNNIDSFIKSSKRTQNNNDNEIEEESYNKKIPNTLTSLNREVKEKENESLIGRDKEITLIEKTLKRLKQGNPILVGKSGTGKTAIVEELARRINNNQVPDFLKNIEILSLNMSQIVAGTRYRGEFEEKLLKAIKFIKNNSDKYILFIDEAHTIIGSGAAGDSQMDGANILKPFLSGGEIRCITATTEDEFLIIDKDPAFQRRFKKILIKEPNKNETIEIINGIKHYYEDYHDVRFSNEIVELVVDLASEYIFDTTSPSKEINILDDLGTINIEKTKVKHITEEDVYKVISESTGMPVGEMTANQSKLLSEMKTKINSKVFGQEEAVSKISSVLSSSFVGLSSENKPLGTFLLAGPTGVGKTEICKQISDYLNMPLIRFDMSEYQEPHSISKLIGSPPGYVGFEEGGKLINSINNNPYSIILFDEIEKAHPKIMDIFLQLLDEGLVTDAKGKKANFRKTIVFMTSNIGTFELNKGNLGFTLKIEDKKLDHAILEKSLKPELINRYDAIIQFNHINEDTILPIVEKHIENLTNKMLKKNKIKLKVSSSAKKELAKLGFDRSYGARPLEREINKQLISPISSLIIENKGKIKNINVKLREKKILIEND